MSPFLLLLRLRVAEVTRSRTSTMFFLGLPLVLLLVIGLAFMNGHPFERHRVAFVGDVGTYGIDKMSSVHALREDDERVALGKLRSRELHAIVVQRPGGLALVVGSHDDVIGRGLASALPPGTPLEVVTTPRWGYVHYLFPGLLAFSILLSGLFGMGYFLVRHRQNLFLKKLATTPLPKTTFVGAQIVARSALVLGQMVVLVLTARFVFDLPLSVTSGLWLSLFTLLGILAFMGLGFALACVVKTEATMVDVINSITTPLVLLSEIFFPVDELPAPIARFAGALPSTQLVRLVRAVLLHGESRVSALLP
ncbi:MAG: ABC transporter permease, partial [Polyangiales bacterium]